MERTTRRRLLRAGAAAGAAGLAGCLGGGGGDGGGSGDGSDGGGGAGGSGDGGSAPAWRTTELTDVRTGESFRIADLDTPLLLETFAVWCSTCLAQQREMKAYHEGAGADVASVTLNVDPNEDAGRVRDHLERHGFDWRYAVSPAEVTNSLVEEFGSSMTVPPQAPVVVVCADGARRLPDGVKSAGDLASAVDQGC
jgi:hypothetical protein